MTYISTHIGYRSLLLCTQKPRIVAFFASTKKFTLNLVVSLDRVLDILHSVAQVLLNCLESILGVTLGFLTLGAGSVLGLVQVLLRIGLCVFSSSEQLVL